MASINLTSNDGGCDDGSRSSIRSHGVYSEWSTIISGDIDELSPPVVSVTAPAASPPSSSSVQEQILNPSDWDPTTSLTESSPDGSGTECQPEGSHNGGDGSNAVKKHVWSIPSNGVVEVVSPVMDDDSWPALGESTKASPNSSSSESLQAISDGSSRPALRATGNPSPSPLNLANAINVNPTLTPNHIVPSGQRSMRRDGGSSAAYISSNGGSSQRPPANQDLNAESPRNTSYPRDQTHRESIRGGFGSQSNSGNVHHHQRNSYRRGNGGIRGNQEWNQHRSFNNRDNNMQPQRGFRRGYIRPPIHTPPPYFLPRMQVPMRPPGNNVMYSDMTSHMVYPYGPFPPEYNRPPLLVPSYLLYQDPVLIANIQKQIDYYFSNDNLVKDTFLRRHMDEQGWVSVNLIAGFKKVSSMTDNVQLILDVMRVSTLVEVQGDKLRRRYDWMNWLIPPTVQYSNVSSPATTPRTLTQDTLASHLQGMTLGRASSNSEIHIQAISSSGESSSQLQERA